MTTKQLKQLRSISQSIKIHNLAFGHWILCPTEQGMSKSFKPLGELSRVCEMSFRYNGDEVVFTFQAYWTPEGVFWWEKSVFNMRTLREMRDDAARTLLYDLKRRAELKSYDTTSVKMKTIDSEKKILICEGQEFGLRPTFDLKGFWVSVSDNEFWELASSVKDAKIKVHKYVVAQSSNINQ